MVCRQVMFCAVTPRVSQTRASSGPTSTVTTRWCGPTATAEITLDAAPVPVTPTPMRRCSHFSPNGIAARTPMAKTSGNHADIMVAP